MLKGLMCFVAGAALSLAWVIIENRLDNYDNPRVLVHAYSERGIFSKELAKVYMGSIIKWPGDHPWDCGANDVIGGGYRNVIRTIKTNEDLQSMSSEDAVQGAMGYLCERGGQ